MNKARNLNKLNWVFIISLVFISDILCAKSRFSIEGYVVWTGYGLNKKEAGDIKVDKTKSFIIFNKHTVSELVVKVDLNTLQSSRKDLTQLLKSENFFDVKNYNDASLISKRVKLLKKISGSEAEYEILADLKIKTKIKPIKVQAKIKRNEGVCSGESSFAIQDRTEFGLKFNSKKYTPELQLGDLLIEDYIDLQIFLTCKSSSKKPGRFYSQIK